jgi:hypothetical protein
MYCTSKEQTMTWECPCSDIVPTKSAAIDLPRPTSPFIFDDVTQRVRQQNLITRFNDMFAQDRLDAMDTLRRYSDDHDNNQRIVFTALQVCIVQNIITSIILHVFVSLAGGVHRC